jgi:F-type H+-transporting ATPase subunit alpha
LERAARLSSDLGGGSITALPIIETLSGDISAYIPTNVISITDGQIFLESELFHAGFRPAINVGLSVSRVGGTAQTSAMKKVVSSMRIELARYRELQVFSQLGSDLDASTRSRLNHGEKLMETIKQRQYVPVPMEEQVVIFYSAKNGYMTDIPTYDVVRFNNGLVSYVKEKDPSILDDIRDTRDFSQKTEERLNALAKQYKSAFVISKPQ